MEKLVRDRWCRKRSIAKTGIPGRVKKEFAKDVCINNIMAKMKRGISPPAWLTQGNPRYGDFTKSPQTLMEAFEVVKNANEAFLSLPVEFRRDLDHDPRNLDKAPRELYEKHGLLKKPKAQEGGNPRSELAASSEGSGDKDLPTKARMGNKKGGHSAAPQTQVED